MRRSCHLMKDLPAPVIATGRRYYPDKSLERLRGRCLRRGKHTVGYYSRERKVGRDYLVAAACERLEVTSFQGHAASFARREKDRPNARAIIFPVVRSGRYDWSFAGGLSRASRGKSWSAILAKFSREAATFTAACYHYRHQRHNS